MEMCVLSSLYMFKLNYGSNFNTVRALSKGSLQKSTENRYETNRAKDEPRTLSAGAYSFCGPPCLTSMDFENCFASQVEQRSMN